jgi:hypothetical protein
MDNGPERLGHAYKALSRWTRLAVGQGRIAAAHRTLVERGLPPATPSKSCATLRWPLPRSTLAACRWQCRDDDEASANRDATVTDDADERVRPGCCLPARWHAITSAATPQIVPLPRSTRAPSAAGLFSTTGQVRMIVTLVANGGTATTVGRLIACAILRLAMGGAFLSLALGLPIGEMRQARCGAPPSVAGAARSRPSHQLPLSQAVIGTTADTRVRRASSLPRSLALA